MTCSTLRRVPQISRLACWKGRTRCSQDALLADARLAGYWREALQIDPLAPGVLPKLILGSSATATGCRAILYSTTNPRRVAEAASAVSSPLDPEILTRFRALVDEFRGGAAA